MFDSMKFAAALFAGAASATVTHLAGQMMPGGYVSKLGAQVATTAAVTGALHVGGAPDHVRDAAAVGGGAVIATRVADEFALYQAVAKARESATPTQQQGAQNQQQDRQNGNGGPTSGLGDGRRVASWRQNARAY